MRTVLELAAKALLGGTLVVAFALLAEMLTLKRLAGVFAAAPSVALASLSMTVLFTGAGEAKASCAGMAAGAVGFVAYCAVAPAALRRFGALRGAAVALLAWLAVAGALLPLAATSAAGTKAAAILTSERRPRLRAQPDKVREARPRDALVRFAFGGGTSLLAAVLAKLAGPVVGGTFLAFPAILLASLTLVADKEGQAAARDDARGAAAGATGLVAFALLGAWLFGGMAAPSAFIAVTGGWLVVSTTCYGLAWCTGKGADEHS